MMNSRRRRVVPRAARTLPGDRHPPIDQVYPPEAFYHNGKGGRVLDVTKPPYGFLLARDVHLGGYRDAIVRNGRAVWKADHIDEYVSATPVGPDALGPSPTPRLPIKDSPLVFPERDVSNWAGVDAFGAVGDGVADDTAAVQRAMRSGKPVVYFPKANYVINGTLDIPATVREVTCLFGAVHRATAGEADGPALFRVAEPHSEPLRLHQIFTAGGVLLDHEADRPVLLEDVHVWFHHARDYANDNDKLLPSPAAQNTDIWRLYRNPRPAGAVKEVFVNDSLFFAGDDAEAHHALENVRAWVRMPNTENLPGALYSFRRSEAWIFGFKSEYAGTLIQGLDGSRIEVLGGSFLDSETRRSPVIVSRDSLVFAIFFMWHWGMTSDRTVLYHEKNGVIATVPAARFRRLARVDGAVIAIQNGCQGGEITPETSRSGS